MEFSIKTIHGVLQGFGVEGAYGIAIISFTLLLKGLTLPLNKAQIESTSKMQAIQPAAKALQDKYKDRDPARLNQELQALYQDNQVNPLAGCLPAFAQIPLFIGLYRSLLNLAIELDWDVDAAVNEINDVDRESPEVIAAIGAVYCSGTRSPF